MIARMRYLLSRARTPLYKYILRLLLVLCLSATILPPPVLAKAETAPSLPSVGDYACILADDVFFYAAPDERRGVFLLPKSYYVRLMEYGTTFCKVEYQRNESAAQRLVGYAKTEELTFVNYVPVRPYLYYVFDVKYTIEDAETGNSSLLTEITLSCVYYGDYRVGSETYCYVLRGEEFGYIPKPSGFSYDPNTEYADYLSSLSPPSSDSSEEPLPTDGASPMQIAILIVICLLVPVLAALILKPPKKPTFDVED